MKLWNQFHLVQPDDDVCVTLLFQVLPVHRVHLVNRDGPVQPDPPDQWVHVEWTDFPDRKVSVDSLEVLAVLDQMERRVLLDRLDHLVIKAELDWLDSQVISHCCW